MSSFIFAQTLDTIQTILLVSTGTGLIYWVVNRLKKNRFVEYGVRIRQYDLGRDDLVQYAEWQHRKTRKRNFQIRQSDINDYRRFVSEGDFVVDIGAYSGDKTVPMSLAAGASGLTLAIEPNPHVFRALVQNTTLNCDRSNIVALNIAATKVDGSFTFHYSDGSFNNGGYLSKIKNQKHSHRHELKVQGQNLEHLLRRDYGEWLNRLSLIKIDAEGYDKSVISSIKNILWQFRPHLICEVYKHLTNAERDQLFDVLQEAGYDLLSYEGDKELTRSDLYSDRTIDILAQPKEAVLKRSAA